MTTYTISNSTEWNNFSNDPLGSGDKIELTSNITFTSEPTKRIQIDSGTFDGQNYTITLESTSSSTFDGLLTLGDGTVENLRLSVASGQTIKNSTGWIVGGSGASGTINRCSSDADVSASSTGGIVGPSFSGTISHCLSTGDITGTHSGGITANEFTGTARYCYHSGDVTGTRAGGIIAISTGSALVEECISFSQNVDNSSNSNTSGAIIGYHYVHAGTTTIIKNCYALNGALVGHVNCQSSVTATMVLENSYTEFTYLVNNLSHGGTPTLTLDVQDCVYSGTANTPYGAKTSPWSINESADTSHDLSVIDQQLLSSWSTSIWTAGDSVSDNYPSLDVFSNSSNWIGYSDYETAPSLTNGGGGGDPHITTLLNEKYDYNFYGYSRYFNTLDDNLFINCLITEGSGIWHKKKYIRELYIHYKSSYIELDTGFRGDRCKILQENINDDITIQNKDLQFNEKAKNLCFGCSRCVNVCRANPCSSPEYRNMIRNKITINLEDGYTLEITNVNKFNYDPCEILLKTDMENISNYQGFIISKEWDGYSSIKNKNDINFL